MAQVKTGGVKPPQFKADREPQPFWRQTKVRDSTYDIHLCLTKEKPWVRFLIQNGLNIFCLSFIVACYAWNAPCKKALDKLLRFVGQQTRPSTLYRLFVVKTNQSEALSHTQIRLYIGKCILMISALRCA